MQLLYTDRTPTGRVFTGEKELLFFSGFSYLGLHALPAFKELLKAGIDQYGSVFISSRIANVRLRLYEELEEALAGLLQQEAAATFSSGYLASQAAAQYAASCGQLLYVPGAHPSLYTSAQAQDAASRGQLLHAPGAHPSSHTSTPAQDATSREQHMHAPGTPAIPTADWQSWTAQTIQQVNAHPDHTFVIVADSVQPLTSTINDFSWLQQLQRQVLVLIDDSHGIGVLGPAGNGIIHTLPHHPTVRYLISASTAKAYSAAGGVVAGSEKDIAALKKLPFFTGATPMMPANAWAFLQSFSLHTVQRNILRKRITDFVRLTQGHDYISNPAGLPIFLIRDHPDMATRLQEKDVIISSFSYPYPDSPLIQRIIISASHSDDDLHILHSLLTNL
jgi:8-amino-7-oxononanoate synthase